MDVVNSAIHNSGMISLSIVTTKKLLYDIVDQKEFEDHTYRRTHEQRFRHVVLLPAKCQSF